MAEDGGIKHTAPRNIEMKNNTCCPISLTTFINHRSNVIRILLDPSFPPRKYVQRVKDFAHEISRTDEFHFSSAPLWTMTAWYLCKFLITQIRWLCCRIFLWTHRIETSSDFFFFFRDCRYSFISFSEWFLKFDLKLFLFIACSQFINFHNYRGDKSILNK